MLIVVLGTILLLSLMLYVVLAVIYIIEKRGEQTITFRQYRKISAVAPKKWEIYSGVYCYLLYHSDGDPHIYTKVYMKTYFDCLRLSRIYHMHNKRRIEQVMDEERAKLIKSWQQDINDYHDDYLKEIGVYLKKGKML